MRPVGILFVVGFSLLSGKAFSQTRAGRELRLSTSCGVLRITAQAENAVRVRCGSGTTNPEPELIFAGIAQTVRATLGSDARSSWLQTAQIKAVVDKRSGMFAFWMQKGSS